MVNSHLLPKAEWNIENRGTTNKVKKKKVYGEKARGSVSL